MSDTSDLVRDARSLLPPLDRLEATLRRPGALMPPRIRERAIIIDGDPAVDATAPAAEDAEARQLLEDGRRALEKVNRAGEAAELSDQERLGLEAIILEIGRPAILVLRGRFAPPPENWAMLETFRQGIETTIQSVGRIEIKNGEMAGSGFLVGPSLVMTNRHVLEELADRSPLGQWSFISGFVPQIDFVEEKDAGGVAEFRLVEVVAVADRPEVDLALLRISSEAEGPLPAGWQPPAPLTVSSSSVAPASGGEPRAVYVVGYPAADNEGLTAPEVLRRIFSNVFEVKRLQPGFLRTVFDDAPVFTHDCSTLGGNSGSCVVDLATNQVIGLHYKGRYRKANYAVALWRLAGDRAWRDAGVNFD